jgi:predicted RNase H-like HicB family nuclease
MHLKIELGREDNGRWIAEIPQLPGVMVYGATADEASARVQILALRVLAERLEQGEAKPVEISISLAAA